MRYKMSIAKDNDQCSLCQGALETLEHIFIQCSHTNTFKHRLKTFINNKIDTFKHRLKTFINNKIDREYLQGQWKLPFYDM